MTTARPPPAVPRATPLRAPTHPSAPYSAAQVKPTWWYLPRGCGGGGANRRRARWASATARAARAAAEYAEGWRRCVRYCPPPPSLLAGHGHGTPQVGQAHGARPTNEAFPRLWRPSLRVPSRTAARLDQQVRPPPLPCLAPSRSRSPAHAQLRRAAHLLC